MGPLVSDMLRTIDGCALYDSSYRTALMRPRVLMTIAPRLLSTAEPRWEQEARPAYQAVVDRWQAVNVSTASAAELLVGTREILHAAASYYLIIQSGILPVAYLSESIFTLVYVFFQAEDGIRHLTVTGVQTCALPISSSHRRAIFVSLGLVLWMVAIGARLVQLQIHQHDDLAARARNQQLSSIDTAPTRGQRSEERRVGKECRSRWSPYH